jgi:hypothetical protein
MPFERRNLRVLANLAVGILGSLGLCVALLFAIGHTNLTTPDPVRIVGATLVVALAMLWACWFAVRAHFAEDEYRRQQETFDSFWGGWLGIGASAPVFVFIAMGGLRWLDLAGRPHGQVFRAFVLGYLLPVAFATLGVVVARVLRRLRDKRIAPVES